MFNISTLRRIACLSSIAAAFVLLSGNFSEINAQRDPFMQPSFMKPKPTAATSASTKTVVKTLPPAPVNYGPPTVESRIEYFKNLRETARVNGSPLPKVTSVLTLNEMAVTGIFKTPRGYAAVVEALPIKLSYTIYPGEKFFDGQLVAVEDNRLVFRKVTKVGEGKFVASVENKPLRQYTTKAEIEGTAPTQAAERPIQTASNTPPIANPGKDPKAIPSNPFLSPVDEMNKQPAEPVKPATPAKKPATKVAKNKKP
ncbi:hypothetical protein BH10ACI2_BH10ACI2_19840 [soil metagenome]